MLTMLFQSTLGSDFKGSVNTEPPEWKFENCFGTNQLFLNKAKCCEKHLDPSVKHSDHSFGFEVTVE